jgi:hypothetical protein
VFVFVIVLRVRGKEVSVSLSEVSLSLLESVSSSGLLRCVGLVKTTNAAYRPRRWKTSVTAGLKLEVSLLTRAHNACNLLFRLHVKQNWRI